MPYTAPLKSSPSAQHVEHSKPIPLSCPSSPLSAVSQTDRPYLPRSYSSTAYVRRHRRSPSNSKSFTFPAGHSPQSNYVIDPYASIRQSPPPVSGASLPPGAVISPPESAPNSSDEESTYHEREVLNLEELEAAVRSIEQRRVSSPERHSPAKQPSPKMAPMTNTEKTTPPPLSKEARKISHSRSATEGSIKHEEVLMTSPEESDRDDEPHRKQPMVRKKSGELVRPALRASSSSLRRPCSMPGTPTYSKAVHFDSQLEHIRHFLQLDKPQAVSADTSPAEDYDDENEFPFPRGGLEESSFEWELRLPNFPKDSVSRACQRVRLERLFLSSDKSNLVGVVAVANLAFHKHVAARFTYDYWKTVSEVAAEYKDDVRRKEAHDGYDRFSFSIKLDDQTNLDKKTMFICIRYSVDGQEFWDNNDIMNYEVHFLKALQARPEARGSSTTSSRPALPRSKSFAGSNPRHRPLSPSFDDFSDMNDYLSFGRPKKATKGGSLEETDTVAPVRRDKQARQAFGNRYDFEASLSAVMRTNHTLDRTTLTAHAKSGSSKSAGARVPAKKETGLLTNKASPLSAVGHQTAQPEHAKQPPLSSQPNRESSVYQELVDKYCFFGSSKGSTNANRAPNTHSPEKMRLDSSSTTSSSSPSLSPTLTPRTEVALGGGSQDSFYSFATPTSSSPNTFEYAHHTHMQDNFLKETKTPAVIRGTFNILPSLFEKDYIFDSILPNSTTCLPNQLYAEVA